MTPQSEKQFKNSQELTAPLLELILAQDRKLNAKHMRKMQRLENCPALSVERLTKIAVTEPQAAFSVFMNDYTAGGFLW